MILNSPGLEALLTVKKLFVVSASFPYNALYKAGTKVFYHTQLGSFLFFFLCRSVFFSLALRSTTNRCYMRSEINFGFAGLQ